MGRARAGTHGCQGAVTELGVGVKYAKNNTVGGRGRGEAYVAAEEIMRRSLLATWLIALALSACAAFAPRIQGQTDILAWQATDLSLEQKTVNTRSQWYYSFNLLVREVRGTAVTFNEIETTIYQPGVDAWTGRYRGNWRLEAKDQFRIPLVSGLFCHPSAGACLGTKVPIPLWRITMRGTDDSGRLVRAVIDLSLPPDPPSPPQTTSNSVRSITLVPPKTK